MATSRVRRLLCAALVCLAASPVSTPAQSQGGIPQPGNPVALDNEYVRVSRDAAPCASAAALGCEDRVIVAMGDIELGVGNTRRKMKRGEVAVFKGGESYQPPAQGSYYEVAIKPGHPPVKSPPELIPPPMNLVVYEGTRFFIYEERLDRGDTRPRHSHSQRVELRANQGPQLQQWVWRGNEVQQIEPAVVNWREPVIHVVKNVGDMPLRNIIIEFRPEPPAGAPSK